MNGTTSRHAGPDDTALEFLPVDPLEVDRLLTRSGFWLYGSASLELKRAALGVLITSNVWPAEPVPALAV